MLEKLDLTKSLGKTEYKEKIAKLEKRMQRVRDTCYDRVGRIRSVRERRADQ